MYTDVYNIARIEGPAAVQEPYRFGIVRSRIYDGGPIRTTIIAGSNDKDVIEKLFKRLFHPSLSKPAAESHVSPALSLAGSADSTVGSAGDVPARKEQ